MTRPIGAVKREIRILGLDFCNTRRITGVISRGGNYLDGVLAIQHDDKLDDRMIAKHVLEIRHYPELRAIMVHDPRRRSDPSIIEEVARLPVIMVSEKKPPKDGFKLCQYKRGRLWIQTSLDSETIAKIIPLTWRLGVLPEPARVAHLLARASIRNPDRNNKE